VQCRHFEHERAGVGWRDGEEWNGVRKVTRERRLRRNVGLEKAFQEQHPDVQLRKQTCILETVLD
jgi:hypothetical protein